MAPRRQRASFTIAGPISRADLPRLHAQACAILRMQRDGPRIVYCDTNGARADAVTLDALASLQLAARRHGRVLRLRGSSRELRELIALAGLADVLAEG